MGGIRGIEIGGNSSQDILDGKKSILVKEKRKEITKLIFASCQSKRK